MSTDKKTRQFPLARGELAALIALLWLYQFTRLWSIAGLPMFLDESVYLWYGRLVRLAGDWQPALRDGNVLQPLALSLAQAIVGDSPSIFLFVGRWLTAALGGLAIPFYIVVGRQFGSARVGVIAALLHVCNPFALFYDRMVLTDSLVALMGLVCLWLSWRLVEHGRWRDAALLGLCIGLVGLTKVRGIFVVLMPLAALVSAREIRFRHMHFLQLLSAYVIGGVLLAPVALAGTLGNQFGNKATIEPSLVAQVQQVVDNLSALGEWLQGYLPGGWLWLAALLSMLGLWRMKRRAWSLLAYGLALVCFYVLIARVWYPRYVLPLMPLFWLCVASGMEVVAQRINDWQNAYRRVVGAGALALLAVALLPSLAFDAALISDPATAPWPAVERWQYIEGWPAGYGLREVVDFFKERARQSEQGIYVAHFPFGGLAREGLILTVGEEPSIQLREIPFSDLPRQLSPLSKEKPTYLLIELPRYTLAELGPRFRRAEYIFEVKKPGGQSSFVVYQWPP